MLLSFIGLFLVKGEAFVRARLSFAFLFCALSALPAAAAPLLSFDPLTPTVNQGDTFAINVTITGADRLYSYGLDIHFDPSVLQALSVVNGAFLGTPADVCVDSIGNVTPGACQPPPPLDPPDPFPPVTVPSPGYFDGIITPGAISFINGALVGNQPGISGDGVLATLFFKAIDAGTSPLSFFCLTDELSCVDGTVLIDDGPFDPGSQIAGFTPFEANTGRVTVNAVAAEVPEPSTMILLGTGLAIAARKRLARARAKRSTRA